MLILAQTEYESKDVEYIPEEIGEQDNMGLKNHYDNLCNYCDYVHMKGTSCGEKIKCCLNGAALYEPFSQLQPPPHMLHCARDRIHNMGRNSVSYDNVLCCSATGAQNSDGGGFETMHGIHADRLHRRT